MKAYVAIPYTDADGEHAVNEEVELPRETDQEKVAVETLLAYGIVSRSPTKAAEPEESDAKKGTK